MPNEYRTEIERFITRSLVHLERTGKDGINITIGGTTQKGKRFDARIRIEFENEENEEEQH